MKDLYNNSEKKDVFFKLRFKSQEIHLVINDLLYAELLKAVA